MPKRDYYEILGVSKTADAAEIKQAFRRLAMKYHPDRNPNDKSAEEKFKEAKEAYDVLSDTQKRSIYDQHGHEGYQAFQSGGHAGSGGFGGFSFEDIFGGLGNVFGDIFTGGGRGGAPGGGGRQSGSDLRYRLVLSLEEAVKGVSKSISLNTYATCEPCHGAGIKPGSSLKVCEDCEGSGYIRLQQGFFSVQQTCPTCHGRGKTASDPCTHCHGEGRVKKSKTLSVKIPAGVDTGDQIRLNSEGEAGFRGGPAGDLYIEVQLTDHPVFERKGNDLYCEVPISFTLAVLGGEIDILTLEGQAKLKIPPETQSGKLFRLRGKGIKSVRGPLKGDLLCRIVVEVPVKLNKPQKKMLEDFERCVREDQNTHYPQQLAWEERLKK